jgi:polyisoprenoid-binding protein YceI
MNRRLVLVGGLVVLVAIGAGAFYTASFFTPKNSAQQASQGATLSTPSASPAVGSSLAGAWTVTSGSTAGYRATEQFVGQSSPNKAIADSAAVSGGMTITSQGGQLTATGLKVVVDLTQLHSTDAGAVHGNFQRDQFVGPNWLETGSFPTATYAVDSIPIPAAAVAGGQQQLSTQGKLTIHGTTKTVSIPMTGQVTGDKLEVAGSVDINMTDYGVQPPSVPFTSVQPGVTIAFHLFFKRG